MHTFNEATKEQIKQIQSITIAKFIFNEATAQNDSKAKELINRDKIQRMFNIANEDWKEIKRAKGFVADSDISDMLKNLPIKIAEADSSGCVEYVDIHNASEFEKYMFANNGKQIIAYLYDSQD